MKNILVKAKQKQEKLLQTRNRSNVNEFMYVNEPLVVPLNHI